MEGTSTGSKIRVLLGIIVSLICIIAILRITKPGEIWEVVRQAKVEMLVLAFLGLIGFLVIRAIRWRFMLNGGWNTQNGIAYQDVFHTQNVGYLVTNILPFRLGDVARAVLIGNIPPITVGKGLSTVIVERVLDMLVIVILFPFTIATAVDLPREWQSAVIAAGVLSIGAAVALIIAANLPDVSLRIVGWICDRSRFLEKEKWLERVGNLLSGLDTLTRWKDAIILLVLSAAVWLPLVFGYYAGIRAVNLDANMVEAAFVVCVAALSLAAPSSPGGLGVQEFAIFTAMSTIMNFPEDAATSFALIYRSLYYLLTGVLGIVGINRLGESFRSIVASTRTLVGSRSK